MILEINKKNVNKFILMNYKFICVYENCLRIFASYNFKIYYLWNKNSVLQR